MQAEETTTTTSNTTIISPDELVAARIREAAAWDELEVAKTINRYVSSNRQKMRSEAWLEEAEAAREGLERKSAAWHQAVQEYEELYRMAQFYRASGVPAFEEVC